MTPSGALTTLYNFGTDSNNDYNDWEGVTLISNFSSDHTMYGTHFGQLFSLTTSGSYTLLSNTSQNLGAPLYLAGDGNFYCFGTLPGNVPALFKVTPTGTVTTLLHGNSVTVPSLLLKTTDTATSHTFYGAYGSTMYKVVTDGTSSGTSATQLASLNSTQGDDVKALLLGSGGNFYGISNSGGPYATGAGTVFEFVPPTGSGSGTITVLYDFVGTSDGSMPIALSEDSYGNFYGVTAIGGEDYGVAFEVTPTGVFSNIGAFTGTGPNSDGTGDGGVDTGTSLILEGNTFYGGAMIGGQYAVSSGGAGTIYQITGAGTNNLPDIASLSLSSPTVVGGNTLSGTVTLTGPAPSGGVYVTITTSNPTVVSDFQSNGPPPTAPVVEVASGTSSATFTLYTTAVTASTAVTVYAGAGASAPLTVLPPAPTISSFSPSSGIIGSTVTITGTNLQSVRAIRFHDASATTFSVNQAGTQIMVTVPVAAQKGTFTVTTDGGSVTSATPFIITPTFTSFNPSHGAIGATVMLNGTGLAGTAAVTFYNGKTASFTVVSDSKLTVTVPAGATTGVISITTPGGTVTSTNSFAVP